MFKVFQKQRHHLIGVDISSTSVKVLELSIKNGRYWVESYGLSPLKNCHDADKNSDDPDVIANALVDAIHIANPYAHQAAIAIPSRMAIEKIIEMDAELDDDSREMQIRLQADQHIPFPLEEVSLDFEVLGPSSHAADQVNVLLVAARTEHIQTRVKALELAGLSVTIADVERYAIERASEVFSDLLPIGTRLVAILDIGHTLTTLSVLEQRKIIYTREHVFGGQQLTQQIQDYYGLSFEEAGRAKKTKLLPDDYETQVLTPFLENVVQHVIKSLQFFYSSTAYHALDHVLLAGGNANIDGLAARLQRKIGCPVSIANPFLHMGLSPQIDQKKLKNDAPSLLTACGLALRSFDP
ncbi:pilus assembly protein PilM [Acinetobacter larvae]|uniref:Pilus assembly protein PilM n=1 Tax=Acinetobacter larvae TaxID=1789224 RepID=A0A1B2M2N1_9GAMM|nr:pilus assembly protein PilM [Acinetobacter larvae]AOA59444.1 pilus assembly protein PilM [Acinetobacter larvae]